MRIRELKVDRGCLYYTSIFNISLPIHLLSIFIFFKCFFVFENVWIFSSSIYFYLFESSQCANDVVLTSVRRRFNVMDVVWTSKGRRVLTGLKRSIVIFFQSNKLSKRLNLINGTQHRKNKKGTDANGMIGFW